MAQSDRPAANQTTMKKKPSKYSSEDDGKIYIEKPPFSLPSQHEPKGWTETIRGYINEAKQLTHCILRNRREMKQPYAWAVHINMNVELKPKEITDIWTKACRNMRRKGLVALWVREPNRVNKVHYHLIVREPFDRRELEKIIEESMPSRTDVKWRKCIQPITNEWRYAHYITKAKIKGRIKGKLVNDLHAHKRRLFKPKLGLQKYGFIGDFWVRPKKVLWQEIKDIEEKIDEGLRKPRIKRLAQHVYDFLGGYVPLETIERNYGYWSESPAIRDWADKLFADEDDDQNQ